MLHTTRADQDEAAPATANRRKTSLRRLCQWAISEGHLTADPTRDVKDLPLGNRAPRAVSDDAIDRVLHAAGSSADPTEALRDEAIITVLAFTGVRAAELANLILADYHPLTGMLRIRLGKGRKSRMVFVYREAMAALERYLAARCPDGHTVGEAANEPLWMHRGGNGPNRPWLPGITTRAIQNLVRDLAGREARQLRADAAQLRCNDKRRALDLLALEVESITPHTFRHSLARRMIEQRADLGEIQAILGHTSLRVTGMYLTPSEEDVREALEIGARLR
ncbi:MAG: tyrosine-type recombinase/integrase [Chloroflexales bacterium]|nr:tyrosine-type recombinase/integrase [Chloroflexales bacterium]